MPEVRPPVEIIAVLNVPFVPDQPHLREAPLELVEEFVMRRGRPAVEQACLGQQKRSQADGQHQVRSREALLEPSAPRRAQRERCHEAQGVRRSGQLRRSGR